MSLDGLKFGGCHSGGGFLLELLRLNGFGGVRRVLRRTTIGSDVVPERQEAQLGMGGFVEGSRSNASPVLVGGQLLATRPARTHLK